MSKIIASAVIRGAHDIVGCAEKDFQTALETYGPDKKVEFPNTGYFLPVIYAMTGIAVKTLGDIPEVLEHCKKLLPPSPSDKIWVPYLGHALDAGMATLFCDEIVEVLKYIDGKIPYAIQENCPDTGEFWLGAADDVIMRKRGIEFVDGTAPGFAAVVGEAETNEVAVNIARELQKKNLYTFISSSQNGRSFADQLREEGVQMGWETRLVPFGIDTTATVFALGFAARAALSFGGCQPGDFRRVLAYNKNRIFAFVLAFGKVSDQQYAQAAGAINYGFPTIANDFEVPQILPTGVCTYEHVVSNIPADKMVAKAIEVRGLKVQIADVPIPVSYGPAFEGERIRKDDTYLEMGGNKTPAFEFVQMVENDDINDGDVEVIGKDITDIPAGTKLPLGIWVQVSGREMQDDFAPILERQMHRLLNCAQGVFHMGQRDINWMRISNDAQKAGFSMKDIGSIFHAKFHGEYGKILDKVAVKIYTDEEKVLEMRDKARAEYRVRDERVKSLTDESVEEFYSCTLCQSFAPTHVCVITPERSGLCGAYNWLDGKAAHKIEPTGPNQPVAKGAVIDAEKGQWQGIDDFVSEASRGSIVNFCGYSIMENPMTSCGCFEAISAILPVANGIMVVNREYPDMTPVGMKFSTLAGSVGGGLQTPGFVGHSKIYVGSDKYLKAEGGIRRLLWMPKMLKEEIRPFLEKRAEALGITDIMGKIADEDVCTTEEELLEFAQKVNHPLLSLDPLM